MDPSGAVIVGARVTVTETSSGAAASRESGNRGEARFGPLHPGIYAIHVESEGFEAYDAPSVRMRAGDNRRQVKLAIAKLAETVQVTREPQERASDPVGDAFMTMLGQSQINELPDDPDEMEQTLRDMAGPGAVLRVNGFRGGKLPPKNQIQQIRFRRSMFAADAHEPGFVFIDILTKPGLDTWRGGSNLGFRDSAMTARNALVPVKGDEQRERYGFNVNGPLWKDHTSLALSVAGVNAYDSQTIVAALPTGRLSDSIQRPNDTLNVTARVEHGFNSQQMLRVEAQRNHTSTSNLGVGDFDLPDRAYEQTVSEDVVRASLSGSIRKALFNELRIQWQGNNTLITPSSTAPAVLVLNAFDSGGAQLSGEYGYDLLEANDDLDIARGRHAIRTGFQLEAGRYHTGEQRNAGGTFTFASLQAYAAGQPTTFVKNVGDPSVTVSQVQAGLYVQDDIRLRKNLTISAGARQEIQSHVGGFHLGPRGGFTWSPFKDGKTTIRAGGGIFYDWFDADSYEQAVQVDGTHQQVETIVSPGYPDPLSGGHQLVLPPGRTVLSPTLTQPELREVMTGVDRQLPGDVRLSAIYMHRQGSNLLRGVNVNAPIAGVRPDPSSGVVTEVESIASSQYNALTLSVNYARPQKGMFLVANYTYGRSIDETDGPFSLPADNYNLAAERGPSSNDTRHRFMSLANVRLPGRVRLGTSIRIQSALPYNITTGHDDNGDTVSNDRPAGVTRNTGRGRAQADVGARVSWSLGIGSHTTPPAGPQFRVVRGDNKDPLGAMGGGPGGPDSENKRYTLELYAQAYNLINHLNATAFSGVMTSPFFGQPTSAAPPRRIEAGVRMTF